LTVRGELPGVLYACVVLSVIAGLLAAPEALAESITFQFEGTVTGIVDEGLAGESFLDGSVTAGTAFTGSYTFDSETSNSSTQSGKGTYRSTGLPYGMTVEVGNYVFRTASAGAELTIEIVDDFLPGRDSYSVSSSPSEAAGSEIAPFINDIIVGWFLRSLSNPLSSVDLLTVPPSLGSWPANELEIFGHNLICLGACPTVRVTGEVGTVVPEPASWVLLGFGAICVGWLRHRGRR
jgi:hypothetical protein